MSQFTEKTNKFNYRMILGETDFWDLVPASAPYLYCKIKEVNIGHQPRINLVVVVVVVGRGGVLGVDKFDWFCSKLHIYLYFNISTLPIQ